MWILRHHIEISHERFLFKRPILKHLYARNFLGDGRVQKVLNGLHSRIYRVLRLFPFILLELTLVIHLLEPEVKALRGVVICHIVTNIRMNDFR